MKGHLTQLPGKGRGCGVAAGAGQGRREGTSWASEGHPSAVSRPFVPLPDPCSEDTYSRHSADGTYRRAPVPLPHSGLTPGTPPPPLVLQQTGPPGRPAGLHTQPSKPPSTGQSLRPAAKNPDQHRASGVRRKEIPKGYSGDTKDASFLSPRNQRACPSLYRSHCFTRDGYDCVPHFPASSRRQSGLHTPFCLLRT